MLTYDEYMKRKKKKNEEETNKKDTSSSNSNGVLTYEQYMEKNKKSLKDEDLAPVKTVTPQKDGRTWFAKGAFSDGYQAGDITKTILGTMTDINEDLNAGIIGMGEKVVDAGAYLVGGVGGLLGADGFKNDMQNFIKKDLYDEEKVAKSKFNFMRGAPGALYDAITKLEDSDKNSVLGDKADSLVQSGGQLLATVGLQSVGVPWFVTTGVTSFGGEVDNAFKQGATYGEAGLSATITAGADILTEKLFGGSGLGEKGLVNLDKLTKGISSKVVKSLVDFGVDMTAEGMEEVGAGIFSNLGTAMYKEENIKDILWSEEATDEYIESFIGGAVLGGGMNAGKLGSKIKTKTDYRSGVTENEQKLIDNIKEKRIAEAEKEAEKLSNKEKNKIEQDIMRELERGEIDIDTIESTLGGESYTAYDSLVKEAEEFKNLNKIKNSELTGEQSDRLAELKEKNKVKPYSDQLAEARNKLSSEVDKATQNDMFIRESYNERGRRGEAFTVSEEQLKKYSEKERAIVQKAIEYGEMNNTRKAHEFVDLEDFAPMTEEEALARDENEMERLMTMQEGDMPPEIDAPIYEKNEVKDPFYDRDIKEVGKRNVNAYMYENPEVKPYFQEEAKNMLGELRNSIKGERVVNAQVLYETNGEFGVWGTNRMVSEEIAYLLDNFNYTYADIEKGLNAIIEDNGKENNAISKRIEFMLDERLREGYEYFLGGYDIPPNQDYIALLANKQITEYSDEAYNEWVKSLIETEGLTNDVAPVDEKVAQTHENTSQTHEMFKPSDEQNVQGMKTLPLPQEHEVKGVKMNKKEASKGEIRSWVETSTESDVVNFEILPADLDQSAIYYQPISNKKTLDTANADLDRMGYDKALQVFNSKMESRTLSLSDIALGERLVQESLKRGDKKTTSELIQDISILGTELGQKVQALSIIQRMTPEGQLKMLQKIVNRGKAKGDNTFKNVEVTDEMVDDILSAYNDDGTYDQDRLNGAVEKAKQKIADQMEVTAMDRVNAWRMLAMLGNPKTHIRNIVSNITMQATNEMKNALARTIETVAPIKNRTKTWKSASEDVKAFAEQSTKEAEAELMGEHSYSENADIKAKRKVFGDTILQKVYDFNSNMLTKEDAFFKRPVYRKSLQEFLTANGIKTQEDINNNKKLVEKGKQYALEQAQIATFQQYSWLANKINEIERKNVATQIGVGSVIPFKKTPINIAKTGLAYSPLGFAKSLSYDLVEMKKGNLEASQVIDNLSKGATGSALTYIGYMLAMSGLLNGGGEDDKEGKYDYQLGEQSYSLNFGGNTYSLSWLTPVAMPLFVGANAYEMAKEGKELTFDTTMDAMAQTLDPMSEMSFLSSLDSVLTSYESGAGKFMGIFETAGQNYATQFAPTLVSQIAQVTDDKKRSTQVSADSDARIIEQTINKLKYKIPGLRQTLEPTIDIWGNEVKQSENVIERAVESFIAPYSRKDGISSEIDAEIKDLYSQTGDDGIIPNVPSNKVKYGGETYKMSANEFADYKKTYGQTANELMEDLFNTTTYKNADNTTKAEMVNRVYDYASDVSKKEYLKKEGVQYTNTTEDGVPVYKENKIKGAIDNDMMLGEFDLYSKSVGKYEISKVVGGFDSYTQYNDDLNDLKADKDKNGKTISGSRKEKTVEYINTLPMDYGQKIILFKSRYKADDTYNYEIIDYLNSREDISYEQMVSILTELDFEVADDGTVRWK